VQVEAVLADITAAIDEIQQQTAEMTSAIGQQAVVADEVARNIEDVRESSDESLTASEELVEQMKAFRAVSKALTDNIGHFRTS
jgi:methyl-accepting chemotaxis protein